MSVCLPAAAALAPLRVDGARLVNDKGETVVLRGVNLGGWLLVESHFMGVPFQDESSLWSGLAARFGADGMRRIQDAYRGDWITPEDFQRVRRLGLNSVRVPFWYGLLEDDAAPGQYRDQGWKWLDRAVDACEAAGIYCVLDLHGAPGGQSAADHTGSAGQNRLWTDEGLQRRAAALWAAVAARYRGRSAIAAFDLLNEPMGAPGAETLAAVYNSLMRAVRGADPDRVVVIEDGGFGLDILPDPATSGWTNVMYSVHMYPTMSAPKPDPETHRRYIREVFPRIESQQRWLGAPIYVGEWSVIQAEAGGEAMTAQYVDEMQNRGWSWVLWTYKQSSRRPVKGFWSFYRNDRPLALPDFERDDLGAILARLDGLRTENMALFGPMAQAVRPEAPAPPRRLPALQLTVPAELAPELGLR